MFGRSVMDEAKVAIAAAQCLALARDSHPRVPAIVQYLSALRDDASWTAEERADLQRRIISALAEANDEVI